MMEIFDCNSSIFFGILEALFDRNRRTLIPSPPIPDEMEIRDVISELFFAGVDILDGKWMKLTVENWLIITRKTKCNSFITFQKLEVIIIVNMWKFYSLYQKVKCLFLKNSNCARTEECSALNWYRSGRKIRHSNSFFKAVEV